MDATVKVLDTLKKAGKALKATEIADLSGLDKKVVDKAMKDLKAGGKISSPKVCYWEPSK
jgi:predicted transcriptional regulator